MHKRFAKDGFVTISVSVDDNARDPKTQKDVLARLTKHGSGSINLILDEESEWVKKQLRFDGLPAVYVFNRQGKWRLFTEFDDEGKTYRKIDALVAEWLTGK